MSHLRSGNYVSSTQTVTTENIEEKKVTGFVVHNVVDKTKETTFVARGPTKGHRSKISSLMYRQIQGARLVVLVILGNLRSLYPKGRLVSKSKRTLPTLYSWLYVGPERFGTV